MLGLLSMADSAPSAQNAPGAALGSVVLRGRSEPPRPSAAMLPNQWYPPLVPALATSVSDRPRARRA
ncbi:hypothetical protein M885DRAFT_562534 [Pelagophyceae sp. CCMP2097]|nr:hypothetical protein M885DRAFT_562534 [Pelagophyceae sp. CCMP2097]